MTFEPSWKRLTAATGGLFIAVLAFLGVRVAAGGDHAVQAAAQTTTQPSQTRQQVAPPAPVTPSDQLAAPQTPQDPSAGQIDANPPRTHSS
jgi:hypothetical protein